MTPRLLSIFPFFFFVLIIPVFSADLYKVSVTSQNDADYLNSLDIQPLFMLSDGYLILVDSTNAEKMYAKDFNLFHVASGVNLTDLAMNWHPGVDIGPDYPLLFHQDNLRIYYNIEGLGKSSNLRPIYNTIPKIVYRRKSSLSTNRISGEYDLEPLINQVNQNTLQSHVLRLEALGDRLTGSDSCHAARDWIIEQFNSYGYDSLYADEFVGYRWFLNNGSWELVPQEGCFNVIVTKLGKVSPGRQIIIGAHYDGQEGSPGADDNATGVAAILEISRILSDIDTENTIIFIAFDSEETMGAGSRYYAEKALDRNDNIIHMMSLDMLGCDLNNHEAKLCHGPVSSYSEIWRELAASYASISAELTTQILGSDHLPFLELGFDAALVIEKYLTPHVHLPSDSAVYINFDYMTRMVKASLATAYVTAHLPSKVRNLSGMDVGDGKSLQVNWEFQAGLNFYRIYYQSDSPFHSDSIDVPNPITSVTLINLYEDAEYSFSIVGHNQYGASPIQDTITLIPHYLPRRPGDIIIKPNLRYLEIEWTGNNDIELDFSHYAIIKDGKRLPVQLNETFFADNDYSLGDDFHTYYIVAVDQGGNISDTVGVEPLIAKVATLTPGKILAVNRSNISSNLLVNEVVTGEYLRESLSPFDFEYYSDTAYNYLPESERLNLYDFLDYELVVVGSESGRGEDLGIPPNLGGILDAIDYYQSIGGKVILFNRWGNITIQSEDYSTIHFIESSPDYYYQSRY
ncbi:MAG: M28 family metallopeptidase, partial [candidate division Zixibacteria bacterium]